MMDVNAINKASNKRTKRSIDILFSLIFLVFSPILIFIVNNPTHFLRNIFQVLIGKKTWVAYANSNSESISQLPRIKEGVLSPISGLGPINDLAFSNKLNIIYAKDYKASTDIRIILKGLKSLGK
jgi:lipopolysaccharide/colanic/teichoic acid biosynthesis glycosyltransferase